MIGVRRFTLEDQSRFARLSGDFNPIHVDPVTARRVLNGSVVVHGVHLLLWTIERLAAAGAVPGVAHIRMQFSRPVATERDVEAVIVEMRQDALMVHVRDGGRICARMLLTPGQPAIALKPLPEVGVRLECLEPTVDQARSARGALDLFLDRSLATAILPRALELLGPLAMAELLATSRLIGMICPGLNSVLGEIDLTVGGADASPEPRLAYEVRSADARFGRLAISVEGPSVGGRLVAVFRPPPVVQRRAVELRSLVGSTEFEGRRALIVGGSRGFGEVTAKLLALGGADVSLTWARGREDAQRVLADLSEAGVDAKAVHYDVLAPTPEAFTHEALGGMPTFVAYFASPPIVPTGLADFSPAEFERYAAFFVTGFAGVYEALRAAGDTAAFFSPSSIYVERPPLGLGEYAAAKAAGETLGRYFSQRDGTQIRMPRLPPARTDQTAPMHGPTADPVTLLLPLLRD
jgi:NAD(P)-dependent dehydrogenase (short-subunit alcohol dehydrogenase family)